MKHQWTVSLPTYRLAGAASRDVYLLVAQAPNMINPAQTDYLMFSMRARRVMFMSSLEDMDRSGSAPVIVEYGATAFVDADDVIFDFQSFFNGKLNERFNLKLPPSYQPKCLTYRDELPAGENAYNVLHELPSTWPAQLRVLPLSHLLMTGLKNLGFQVLVVSAIDPDEAPYRVRAMRQANIPFDALYATGSNGKGSLVRELQRTSSDIFVDDMLKNCAAVKRAAPGVECFSWQTPVNDQCDKAGKDEVRVLGGRDEAIFKVLEWALSSVPRLPDESQQDVLTTYP